MPAAERTTTTIAILGGNAVVGRALEVLLRSVGYKVRFLGEPEAFVSEELLEGIDVLLLGRGEPRDEDRREGCLGAMADALKTAAIPVLSFSPGPEGTIPEVVGRLVPWPCKIEDLAREIEAVLPSRYERVGSENTVAGF